MIFFFYDDYYDFIFYCNIRKSPHKSRTRIEYLNLYLNLILDLSNEQWRKRLRRPWTREKTQFKLWRQIKKHKDTNDLHLIEAKTEKRIKINQICNFDSCMAEVYIRASSVSQWHPVGYSSTFPTLKIKIQTSQNQNYQLQTENSEYITQHKNENWTAVLLNTHTDTKTSSELQGLIVIYWINSKTILVTQKVSVLCCQLVECEHILVSVLGQETERLQVLHKNKMFEDETLIVIFHIFTNNSLINWEKMCDELQETWDCLSLIVKDVMWWQWTHHLGVQDWSCNNPSSHWLVLN